MRFPLKTVLLALLFIASLSSYAAVTVNKVSGWLETAYVEFSLDSQYDGYNVYVKGGQYSSYTKLDNALVRKYTNHGRADALGLKAASDYSFKIVPTKSDVEQTSAAVTSSTVTVKAHDRSGFAFKGTMTPGAYNSDGTLKSNAVVVYVTNSNKNTLKASIIYTSKGVYQECTGILAVLTALKKGYETRPVCIRVIGNITADDTQLCALTDPTSKTNISDVSDFKGDWMFSTNKKDGGGVTIEGVGNDALANGWGVRFKGINYAECRNLGFMNCHSYEGDNVGLQQDNNYCWVHHCDMFYGDAGSDNDQVKGDGAMDCKKSNYITFSYNRFWDSGKCNLLGLSEDVGSNDASPYYITYHHNWYDHSDSRHPRCRFYNAHVYNNYYDGNAKYGAGSTLGSSVFMEGNYFRSCKFPMMISMQGTDVYAGTTKRDPANYGTFSKEAGGMIKAYNNYMTGTCTFIPYGASTYLLKGKTTAIGDIDSRVDFDAFVVDSKSAIVPSSITSYVGNNYYSNFDTNPSMYQYTAQEPVAAMATITGSYGAGRCQHGDFTWTFSSSDDASSDVDNDLKLALTNYKNVDLIGLFNDDTSSSEEGTDPVDPGTDPEEPGTDPEEPGTDPVVTIKSIDKAIVLNLGEEVYKSYLNLTQCNFSTTKGSATYNGVTNSTCMKMESNTNITFTTTKAFDMVMVFGSTETGTAKVDGTKYEASALGATITVSLAAGTHTITKSGTQNLFFLAFAEPTSSTVTKGDVNSDGSVNIVDLTLLISKLNGGNPTPFNATAADVDGKNGVTMDDVEALRSEIMKK